MLLSPKLRMVKLAALVVAGLALTACAKNADDASLANGGLGAGGSAVSGAGGAGTPGSVQDFAVNVGDRVFFDSDQTDLSQTAQATLDKQARWLSRYARYAFTVEGHADERGTREYNFALGARRAETVKELSRREGHPGVPHPHDLLRQGAPGRGLQRHLLLVAEPSRRDGAERRAVVDETPAFDVRFGRETANHNLAETRALKAAATILGVRSEHPCV